MKRKMVSILSIATSGVLGVAFLAVADQPPEVISEEVQTLQDPDQMDIIIPSGTQVPLVLINSISSRHSTPGDKVYLECVYPVVLDEVIRIPAGTRVSGSIVSVKRPGRVKGRGHLYLRFEQIIFPNGVIRSLLGRPGTLDGRSPDRMDRETGLITSEEQKGEDAGTIAKTTAAGASVGAIAGAVGGRPGAGLGGGVLTGAAIGVAQVLLTRGPDVVLERGTHLEMILEWDMQFTNEELQFENPVSRPWGNYGAGPDTRRNQKQSPGIGRYPL